MARVLQRVRLSAKNSKARYKLKYTYSQTLKSNKKRKTTKYSYSKKITVKKKKYSYR